MKRSITASASSTSGESSNPTLCPNAAIRQAQNKRAFARALLSGQARATTRRAKQPAASLTAQGR
jgi:hypothetical protein